MENRGLKINHSWNIVWFKKTHNNLTNKKHSNFYLLAWIKVRVVSFKIKPMKDIRIDLEKMQDLQPEMLCSCGGTAKEPEYVCFLCGSQLVFFVNLT